MRHHLAAAATLAFALAAPVSAHAQQQPAAQLAITRAVSVADGGWEWAEAVLMTGVRVSLPVRGATYAWAGVARGYDRMYICPDLPNHGCEHTGDLWMFQAGGDYRFGGIAGLTPYVGAGASLERWEGGAHALIRPRGSGLAPCARGRAAGGGAVGGRDARAALRGDGAVAAVSG